MDIQGDSRQQHQKTQHRFEFVCHLHQSREDHLIWTIHIFRLIRNFSCFIVIKDLSRRHNELGIGCHIPFHKLRAQQQQLLQKFEHTEYLK